MTERTWKIRDQLPEGDPRGDFGPEREVTLAQFRAEIDAAKANAMAIYRANVAALRRIEP
jgi:hypothetical protein